LGQGNGNNLAQIQEIGCGLARQYLPKGSYLSLISDEQLAFVVKRLNNRPRKCLNYRTLHEVFFGTLSGALII